MLKEVAVAKFVLLARDCPGSAQNIVSLDRWNSELQLTVLTACSWRLVLECYVGADMTTADDMDRSDWVDEAARRVL